MTIVEHIIINLAFVIIFNMSIIECALLSVIIINRNKIASEEHYPLSL